MNMDENTLGYSTYSGRNADWSKYLAVLTPDSTMEPRYEIGETLYCDLDAPIEPGCYVLVEVLTDGQRTAKLMARRFVGWADSAAILDSINPSLREHVSEQDLKAMLRIVGFGAAA